MKHTITARARVAWWFRPYFHALIFFCALHRREPDMKRLNRVLSRALTIRFA